MNKDLWRISLAISAAERGSCLRDQVGCVAFDSQDRILAIGVNGPPRGMPNCTDKCLGTKSIERHSCPAIHAEQNMLLQCKDIDKIKTVACTMFPCMDCLYMLLNTNMTKLIYKNGISIPLPKNINVVKAEFFSSIEPSTYTYLYNLWDSIRKRCYNPKRKEYKYYGKRGINLYTPWLEDRYLFIKEVYQLVGPRPSATASIDRINNNGNYEPSNIRWATIEEQRANRRHFKTNTGHHHITFDGYLYTVTIRRGGDYFRKKSINLEKAIQIRDKFLNLIKV